VAGVFLLVGLHESCLVLSDDWRFEESVLSKNVQLFWFEGKSVITARPQNQHTGHLQHSGEEPIFITTLEADLLKVPSCLLPGDVAMMKERLLPFRFGATLANPDRTIKLCSRCFAEFLFAPRAILQARQSGRQPGSQSGSHTVSQLARHEADVPRSQASTVSISQHTVSIQSAVSQHSSQHVISLG